MNSVLNLQPIAQFLAEHLLNGVLGGTALALLAWALLRVIGGGNSRARFGVWFSVLLAIGGLPLLDRRLCECRRCSGRTSSAALRD